VEAFHATLEEVVEADMLVVGVATFLMSLVYLGNRTAKHEVDVVLISWFDNRLLFSHLCFSTRNFFIL
jgi:hypothetical protein